MRIIGGTFKGRSLISPKTRDIRPTSDRVRETLFNILSHNHPEHLHTARVLDLFAGTGGLGLEALSRGASFALFVDSGSEARALIRENIQNCGVAARTKLIKRDATDMGECHPFEPFNLIFIDPPYGKSLGLNAIDSILNGNWVAQHGLIILEESADITIEPIIGLTILDKRIIGDTQLALMQRQL